MLWSAAASTGQEAYSLAMLLCEMGLGAWDIRIVGTDLSSPVLDRAAAGVYNQVEIERGLPVALRAKYCTKRADDSWEINPSLRRLTAFQLFDLRYNVCAFGPLRHRFLPQRIDLFRSNHQVANRRRHPCGAKPGRTSFSGR